MLQPLDGPSLQGVLTVTNTTPVKAFVGASAFSEENKVVTMQSHSVNDPNYGAFYVYFANSGETPSSGDVSSKGFVQDRNNLHSYEAGYQQVIWIMSVTVASIQVRLAERA